jgi:hypothetical protein
MVILAAFDGRSLTMVFSSSSSMISEYDRLDAELRVWGKKAMMRYLVVDE